ncbi:phenylalanine--tRNA ligase subunit alpha [Buchnera aphidicola]|uniref:Phenylalanine--tRNA ligase alpha subunit n=1 Tax=Buchnera aphidicola (Sarucallis kahawaluokalani) TaxID=1241878 RepID=A0A4D6YIS5_9GAMM|nr:phenylalanine--tRNA ligase subunit alpha [Buchnera aphidicola]QCI25894.1 phenylalanine--tRNA ligase subunit alpha [Buchnera aphidicola (Sarucallis kahawaluokalani)]
MSKLSIMFNEIQFLKDFHIQLNNIRVEKELEDLRIKYLGKKGLITAYIHNSRMLELDERKNFCRKINKIKKEIMLILNEKKIYFQNKYIQKNIDLQKIDISLPGSRNKIGCMHPITTTIYYIESIFTQLGFEIITDSLEIENEYYNFSALNIPIFHPARDRKDTFWFNSNILLRTQTSNMQIHVIEKRNLPIKIIVPGKVYRKDYDQTHSPMFHQIEGLIIDQNINFANLKWIISNFLKIFFNEYVKIRFRSSYFPFTVLSAEVDIMRDDNTWLEILGCGMVHPNILQRFDIDTTKYSGIAFGIGVERILMLNYRINDLRTFTRNDLRFLKQFKQGRYFA